MHRLYTCLNDTLTEQRQHAFYWMPVFMGCGISLYLLLPGEPRIDHLLVMCGVCAGAARFLKSENIFLSLCAFIIFCISLGVLVSAFRTHRVEAPILGWRFYGEIEGRMIKIDKAVQGRCA